MGTCSQTTWAKLRTLLTWPPKLLRTLCGRDVDSRQYRPMIMTSELRFVCALGEIRTHTVRVLNPFPLPVGIRGPAGYGLPP
jgi:hypothetical protein